MCIGVLATCTTVYCVCAWCPRRPDEDVGSLRTGVMDVVNLRVDDENGRNPGPLEEQPALVTTEPPFLSLSPPFHGTRCEPGSCVCVRQTPYHCLTSILSLFQGSSTLGGICGEGQGMGEWPLGGLMTYGQHPKSSVLPCSLHPAQYSLLPVLCSHFLLLLSPGLCKSPKQTHFYDSSLSVPSVAQSRIKMFRFTAGF